MDGRDKIYPSLRPLCNGNSFYKGTSIQSYNYYKETIFICSFNYNIIIYIF